MNSIHEPSNSPNQEEQHEGARFLPFLFLNDFIAFVAANRKVVETRTYSELDWRGNFDPATMYQEEFQTWKRTVKKKGSRNKIEVFLQFDVDSEPDASMQIIERLMDLGVTASVMIFNKRVNREKLRTTGEVELTDYQIDDDLLLAAEKKGFTIGYHTNAMERALYNKAHALEIFEEDLAALRLRFPNLICFSPHGGVWSPEGLNNKSIPINQEMQQRLNVRWVHNGRAPKFKIRFSDGGFANAEKDPNRLDLRSHVFSWVKGERHRVLIHPQYYNAAQRPLEERAPNVFGSQWFKDVWTSYAPLLEESQAASTGTQPAACSAAPYWRRVKWRWFREKFQ